MPLSNIEDFMKTFNLTNEEFINIKQERFEKSKANPNNFSKWFPQLVDARNNHNNESTLKIPVSKTLDLPFEWWEWLTSDDYTPVKMNEFNDFIDNALGDFQKDNTVFLKTGVFSNKFNFKSAKCINRDEIAKQFLEIFYTSTLVGADNSSELVVREFIESKEDVASIYNGMPLHTEFRVFYDFDEKEIIGVANYWHPEQMIEKYLGDDFAIYAGEKDQIIDSFNQHKKQIADDVAKFMAHVDNISGKWSVDVMMNGDDLWLIDMALMADSALVQHIVKV